MPKQAHSFELEQDTSGYGEYSRGGIVTQHKGAKQLAFKPLAQALASPGEFLFSDFSKLERPALLHLGFRALDAFQVGSSTNPSMTVHALRMGEVWAPHSLMLYAPGWLPCTANKP
jgi:hypothetical protein